MQLVDMHITCSYNLNNRCCDTGTFYFNFILVFFLNKCYCFARWTGAAAVILMIYTIFSPTHTHTCKHIHRLMYTHIHTLTKAQSSIWFWTQVALLVWHRWSAHKAAILPPSSAVLLFNSPAFRYYEHAVTVDSVCNCKWSWSHRFYFSLFFGSQRNRLIIACTLSSEFLADCSDLISERACFCCRVSFFFGQCCFLAF